MKIIWKIDFDDIERVKKFFEPLKNDFFVQQRINRNLKESNLEFSKEIFWVTMVSCLLTTQQRSGPERPVTKFVSSDPFPLDYKFCLSENDVESFVKETIKRFGGIRRGNRIAKEIKNNLQSLENGLWERLFKVVNELRSNQAIEKEREAADFIIVNFKGFGTKQSRNLLQSLGLTKYEIPLDSRLIKWLNKFEFPVKLSSKALSDPNYYNFVSDGIQKLCEECEIYPCVLDAAIFSSFDKGGWTEKNIVW